jgi:hypothetical protein
MTSMRHKKMAYEYDRVVPILRLHIVQESKNFLVFLGMLRRLSTRHALRRRRWSVLERTYNPDFLPHTAEPLPPGINTVAFIGGGSHKNDAIRAHEEGTITLKEQSR